MIATVRYGMKHVLQSLLRVYRGGTPHSAIFCVPGDHIGDEIFLEGLYEKDLLQGLFEKVFSRLATKFTDSACLDIGANIGNHSMYFASRFKTVFAFEPNPIFCAALRASLALNGIGNVKLFEVGLSDETSVLTYHMNAGSLGESHFVSGSDHSGGTMQLRTEVGDDLLGNVGGGAEIGLIKIDVEGHEYQALKGLRRTITRWRPIILFESHPEKDRAEAERVLELILSYGYGHIYAYERKRLSRATLLQKCLFRLVHGAELQLQPVSELDDLPYWLLVASPDALT